VGEANLSDTQSHCDLVEPVKKGQSSVSRWLVLQGQNCKPLGSVNFNTLYCIEQTFYFGEVSEYEDNRNCCCKSWWFCGSSVSL